MAAILFLKMRPKIFPDNILWLLIYTWIILGIDLAIDPSTIILGNLLTKVDAIPLNTVYLAAKLYIFRKSKLNQIPNYSNFCNVFKKIYFEQEYVAKLELKTINFTKIWGHFSQIFTA